MLLLFGVSDIYGFDYWVFGNFTRVFNTIAVFRQFAGRISEFGATGRDV